jgi:hypothetical protein
MNPTNGRWWIVQVQPPVRVEIEGWAWNSPPMAIGGIPGAWALADGGWTGQSHQPPLVGGRNRNNEPTVENGTQHRHLRSGSLNESVCHPSIPGRRCNWSQVADSDYKIRVEWWK